MAALMAVKMVPKVAGEMADMMVDESVALLVLPRAVWMVGMRV